MHGATARRKIPCGIEHQQCVQPASYIRGATMRSANAGIMIRGRRSSSASKTTFLATRPFDIPLLPRGRKKAVERFLRVCIALRS